MFSDEYVVFLRAELIVCLVRCSVAAASVAESPCVMDGMSCCRNGVFGGIRWIMLMVFCPIRLMMLLLF